MREFAERVVEATVFPQDTARAARGACSETTVYGLTMLAACDVRCRG